MISNPIDDFYSTAPNGATVQVPVIKEITKRRLKISPKYAHKKILIIGDAFAHESKHLASLGFQNITSTIKHTREAIVGKPVVCDIHSLPFDDGSFDLVYCSHVLEHSIAPMIALKEIHRVLKTNGEGLFWMPYADVSMNEPYHYSCFRPYIWKMLIAKTGFDTTKEEDYTPRNEYGYWVKKL